MSGEIALKGVDANAPAIVLNTDDIKRYIAPTATDKELFLFVNIAKSYGLNPFKREVHFVKYGQQQASIVVGYEAYIKRAERTGQLDGWSVELGKDQLGEKATITIHRKDRGKPFIWVVYRSEFDNGQANWKKMPLFMLRKVAISQGFRLAFPEEIGGMPYIPEEINGGKSEELAKGAVDAEVMPDEPAVPDFNLDAFQAKCRACLTLTKLQAIWSEHEAEARMSGLGKEAIGIVNARIKEIEAQHKPAGEESEDEGAGV